MNKGTEPIVSVVSGQAKQRERTTRERLLQVAIEMFAERGYAATGVDALCRKAGVAKTGLYWEFQNKVGLLNAVIDRVMGEWAGAIQDSVGKAREPRDRLDLALAAVRASIRERPELFRVILVVLAERTQVDEEAREALGRFFGTARQAMVQAIQEATPVAMAEKDLKVVADLILAMIEGVFLRLQVEQDDHEVDALFEGIRTAVLLMVRELVAKAQGHSTLVGPVMEIARRTD